MVNVQMCVSVCDGGTRLQLTMCGGINWGEINAMQICLCALTPIRAVMSYVSQLTSAVHRKSTQYTKKQDTPDRAQP